MNYKIGILSYKRPELICKLSLKYLNDVLPKKNKIPIYIFLSNTYESKLYKESIAKSELNKVKDNIKYIFKPESESYLEKMNIIHNFFKKGEKIFLMEDDVKELSELTIINDKKKYKKITNLDKLIKKGFQECEKSGSKIFGFYPVYNPFFCYKTITNDLRFLIATCVGFISTRSKQLEMKCTRKTDYERTMLYYNKYGSIVRFNYISALTKNYSLPGGLEASNRKEIEEENCKYLVEKYPEIVRKKSKSRFCEVSIKKKK